MGEYVTTGIEQYIVSSDDALTTAVEKLSENTYKGLVVTDQGKVVGLFTRHDMVKCSHCFGMQNVKIGGFANRSFHFCTEVGVQEKESMHSIIPVLDEDSNLKGLYFPDNNRKRPHHPMPVVINAGGKGTRLYPYTETIPKPLVAVVNDKPMVEIIMDQFLKYDLTEFHMIVNHKKEMVEEHFQEKKTPYTVAFYEEQIPLGTGGGLYFLKDRIRETFLFSNCDIVLLENCDEIFEYHRESGKIATMVVSLKPIHISYGVIQTDGDQTLQSILEKPTYMTLVNTGIYILEPEIFQYIHENENIGFPDVLFRARADGKDVGIYPITEDRWLDMGQISELEHAREVLGSRISGASDL